MQELTMNDIEVMGGVAGGLTENQCIGLFTLGGAVAGSLALRSWEGVGIGAALGGGFGMVVCAELVN